MIQLFKLCNRNRYVLPLTIILAIALCSWTVSGQVQPGYQNFEQFQSALKKLVKENSGLAAIESIGKTNSGKDLWLVSLASREGTPVSERPGLLVAANLEGDHLIGSEISLQSMLYLVNNYGKNEAVKKALDEHVFYFLPRINPDGAEKQFSGLSAGMKTNAVPYDGDNDGRLDEDGPEDLNGDGIITQMRVKDPNGLFMQDPVNPGLMKKADPAKGEKGEYSIYFEGIDNDGDGFINEDPAGGTDINRNFMHAYPYYKDDAGVHMASENETRAILDWLIANRNVSLMLSFGESDNLISPPNSRGELDSEKLISMLDFAGSSIDGASKVGMVSGRGGFGMGRFGGMDFSMRGQGGQEQAATGRSRPSREPATVVNRSDIEFFSQVSKKYKEITGFEAQPPVRKPAGALFEYGYYQYGIPSFSTPGWAMDLPKDTAQAEAGQRRQAPSRGFAGMRGGMGSTGAAGGQEGEGKSVDATVLEWLKANNPDGFVEWQPVDHPDFDDAEVGGFNLFSVTNPPAGLIGELGEKHSEFLLYLSTLYAKIKIAETEVINHGGGIFRIKAQVENAGLLPTALQQGVDSRGVKPVMVQLGIDPEAIISGNNKTNFIQKLDGSGKRQSYEWLVKGKAGDKIELKAVSQKGGSDSVNIVLK